MEKKIIKIIEQYVDNQMKVNLESYFIEDLCVDSLKMMQIICDTEEQCEVEIEYCEMKEIYTVKDFIQYIERKKQNGNEIL